MQDQTMGMKPDADHRPSRRLSYVHLEDIHGEVLSIPVLDLICVEIEEGKKIFAGRSMDILT
ncbi:hypothetical protein [Lihuaxuella thermophila]|uniref:Uncharacterized protein n=1 Tax=Lihuaxuella thermophila TaxID=1173111 RepID=A0A1H8CRT6_9BACL|nr:hypothetical protein [Lihuaxuella thermophila]SEM97941.1 hypothetical protein SAMN05444955_10492 [Lihuaxuella thermophila]